MDSPLPAVNTDPAKAPVRVEIEWKCETGEVAIDATPRTVALLRGRFGEVEVRTLRVQFPAGLPPEFEAWTAVYAVDGHATKRGIVVARLSGKRRATCYADLPAPLDAEMQNPVLVNRHQAGNDGKDFYIWAGCKREMHATPARALAVVVHCNMPSVCEVMIGGV